MSYTTIKNKKQYQEYSDKVIELASKKPTKEIEDEMELLELLIDNYESKIYATETKDPIVLLKSLMEVHQLKSVDLVNILGIQRSAVSQILSYKKGLSKDVIRKLSEHFKLSQEAFNRSYELLSRSNQRNISKKKKETTYLLSNPNNAKALEESKQEIEQGETIRYKLLELKKKIGNKGLVKKYLVKSTFWDAEFESLDLEKDKGYIISRIAERGTDIEVNFIISYYPKEDVLFVVNNSPEITPKTKNYFNTIVYESC